MYKCLLLEAFKDAETSKAWFVKNVKTPQLKGAYTKVKPLLNALNKIKSVSTHNEIARLFKLNDLASRAFTNTMTLWKRILFHFKDVSDHPEQDLLFLVKKIKNLYDTIHAWLEVMNQSLGRGKERKRNVSRSTTGGFKRPGEEEPYVPPSWETEEETSEEEVDHPTLVKKAKAEVAMLAKDLQDAWKGLEKQIDELKKS
jgi:hypothetical protein